MAITIRVGAPPDQVPLASLSDLKSDLKITDDTQDVDLTRRLLEASGAVLAYIGRPILSSDWRDIMDLRQDQPRISLVLGRYPVTALKVVSINGTAMGGDDLINVFNAMDASCGMLYPPDGGPALWHPARYVVTYTAGYSPPEADGTGGTIPLEIQRAIRITAAASWHGGDRDPNLKSESEQGVGSTSWVAAASGTGGLPQDAANLLAGYRSGGIR
ncbi:hypothetical protein HK16_18900 [Acetobacter senegalensis]|uniref:Phage associated protein n=1 Tax=Acetobacter senegalensis TaxID=446692 RepID=A0A252EF59_9PROT|nr:MULTISPECIES: hypothetical protein [Acetobacter]OUL65121.1 hypothetical protein HK16_18900 [Acetobacter senegalensis]